MKKEKIKEFSFRISQANPTELVVISYDIVLEDIAEAKEAAEAGDFGEYERLLKHSLKIMNEIMGSLDFSQRLSYDLFSLYKFVNSEIIGAMMRKDVSRLAGAVDTLKGLRTAFYEISKLDETGSVMKNVPTTAAGATYGRNAIDDVCFNVSSTRGFMA